MQKNLLCASKGLAVSDRHRQMQITFFCIIKKTKQQPDPCTCLHWTCCKALYLAVTSSFDLNGTVHVHKGAQGLMGVTVLKEIALDN